MMQTIHIRSKIFYIYFLSVQVEEVSKYSEWVNVSGWLEGWMDGSVVFKVTAICQTLDRISRRKFLVHSISL